ncbi:WbqC family protein [Thermosynechococcus sp.]|uniref:WbqC family protein n=1 Tax=Thermosynechococcus sp. TaxID=2814275 RepID=UPI00391DDF22
MTRIVISQPRYLPILSYLQRIHQADVFVFLDNVQRQYRGFENRNQILIGSSRKWLTIPVRSSKFEIICNSYILDFNWVEEHQRKIKEAYKKHPFFNDSYIHNYYDGVIEIINQTNSSYSSTLIKLVSNAAQIFKIDATFVKASELDLPPAKGVENLFNICEKLGASIYISGANGRSYGVKNYFEQRGKKVLFHDPENYSYPQFRNEGDFLSFLSFFDPLFNIGYSETKMLLYRPMNLSEE